ncbi:sensor histidine kinase [Bacillus ndiopicus]|uniref:sensor histidine kinase n=1 Tax=Bacillus ndiopicus TaxID=1347368 RepID=UPI000693B50A|nr:histidine kinase [Bacillus ndiopicus]
MPYFTWRISALLLLVTLFLAHTKLTNATLSTAFFISAGVLAFYFFIPLLKRGRVLCYGFSILLLFSSAFLSLDITYALPIIAYFFIDSALSLKIKSYVGLLSISLLGLIALVAMQKLPLYGALLVVISMGSAFLLRNYVQATSEKQVLYDELLGQYRLLKRAQATQEQLVRTEERTNIARDMHDSVGHQLTALLMHAEMLSMQQDHAAVEEIKRLARASLEETRYAVRQLKASEVYGIQSVLQLIRKLEIESRLHIRFTVEKGVLSVPISNQQSIVLYRILQESLTNAMKHSDFKEVEILLAINPLAQIQFTVKNKLLKQTPIVYGFGLDNMKERIQQAGGTIHIYQKTQYFVVEGALPVKEDT